LNRSAADKERPTSNWKRDGYKTPILVREILNELTMNPLTAAILVFWLTVTSVAFLAFIGVFGASCSFISGALSCNTGVTNGEIFGTGALFGAIAGLAEWPGLIRKSKPRSNA
jgi:hypothetical protein